MLDLSTIQSAVRLVGTWNLQKKIEANQSINSELNWPNTKKHLTIVYIRNRQKKRIYIGASATEFQRMNELTQKKRKKKIFEIYTKLYNELNDWYSLFSSSTSVHSMGWCADSEICDVPSSMLNGLNSRCMTFLV